jgi:hypothetical protein
VPQRDVALAPMAPAPNQFRNNLNKKKKIALTLMLTFVCFKKIGLVYSRLGAGAVDAGAGAIAAGAGTASNFLPGAGSASN